MNPAHEVNWHKIIPNCNSERISFKTTIYRDILQDDNYGFRKINVISNKTFVVNHFNPRNVIKPVRRKGALWLKEYIEKRLFKERNL